MAFAVVAVLAPSATALAVDKPVPGATPASAGTPSPRVIPPYGTPGDDLPRPVRTRQDRIVSTIAPIAMVAVLIAGLYIYWLIRKGL